MESHEVLRRAFDDLGVKSVASDLNLSTSLIYKWCQAKDTPDASGADNPLDRLAKIYELTHDLTPVKWLCHQAGGFYVRDPEPLEDTPPEPLRATQSILAEFSGLLEAVSHSMEDDQQIDCTEAAEIRRVWEDLKSVTETFVNACEKGAYARLDTPSR